jgi:hypothetical protein
MLRRSGWQTITFLLHYHACRRQDWTLCVNNPYCLPSSNNLHVPASYIVSLKVPAWCRHHNKTGEAEHVTAYRNVHTVLVWRKKIYISRSSSTSSIYNLTLQPKLNFNISVASCVRETSRHACTFLVLNFCCVLNVVCFLLGDSPASEVYVPTFRNTSIFPPIKIEQTECSETLAFKLQTPGNHPEESTQHACTSYIAGCFSPILWKCVNDLN